jgi:hypothetical protein
MPVAYHYHWLLMLGYKKSQYFINNKTLDVGAGRLIADTTVQKKERKTEVYFRLHI